MIRAIPCLAFLIVLSCFLVFALVPRYELLDQRSDHHVNVLQHRQVVPTDPQTSAAGKNGGDGGADSTPTSTPATTSTPDPATTSTPPATTSTPPQQATTTQQPTTQNQPTAATTTTPLTTSTPPTTAAAATSTTASTAAATNSLSTTPIVGTQTSTQIESGGASSSSVASAAPASSPSSSSSSSSSSLSTGSIIGMSVAGGVAVIGIVAFFIWKFTRKRFTDFDDNEAIKWPELNSHGGESVSGHALPTHATGRAGFGDDNDNASTIHGGYASSLATTSTPELYPGGGPDPYAVPPLPHLNPNQPYHDEPVGYEQDPNSFYDPYRGPVPNTFNEAGGAEAIPMTQMARTRSPGPQMGYEMGRQSPMLQGRQSPGPQASLGRQSPGPNMGYGGQMMETPGRQPDGYGGH